MMNRTVNLMAGLIICAALPVLAGCAYHPGAAPLLDVKVGSITGPGHEQISQALNKQSRGGQANLILEGRTSFSSQTARERETVPVQKESGQPHAVYKPDPFTARVWRTEETPTVSELNTYDFQRLTGDLIFDWRLVSRSGQEAKSGQVVLNIDHTRGGYLAAKGLAPDISASRAGEDGLEKHLADELVRLIALDIGRQPGPAELESGGDPLSSQARKLAAAGDWDAARALWLKLLTQNPNYAPALYNLGLYWERQKDPEEAWRYYRAAFISDGSEQHRQALTRLTETLRLAGRLPKRGSTPTK